MKENPKNQDDDYGKPRKGINPLTGKPRGLVPFEDVTDTGFTCRIAIVNPPEAHGDDQPKQSRVTDENGTPWDFVNPDFTPIKRESLRAPFFISARLLPALRVGGAVVSLEAAGTTSDWRDRFRYYIDLPDGSNYAGSLKSGVGGCSLQEAFVSLLAFLGAAAESCDRQQRTGRPGENAALCPQPVVEWASQHADEIGLLQQIQDEIVWREQYAHVAELCRALNAQKNPNRNEE